MIPSKKTEELLVTRNGKKLDDKESGPTFCSSFWGPYVQDMHILKMDEYLLQKMQDEALQLK